MASPLVLKGQALGSPARSEPSNRTPLRVAVVQDRWHADPSEHEHALESSVRAAAAEGARLICLQELTLSPYFAISPDGDTSLSPPLAWRPRGMGHLGVLRREV